MMLHLRLAFNQSPKSRRNHFIVLESKRRDRQNLEFSQPICSLDQCKFGLSILDVDIFINLIKNKEQL